MGEKVVKKKIFQFSDTLNRIEGQGSRGEIGRDVEGLEVLEVMS